MVADAWRGKASIKVRMQWDVNSTDWTVGRIAWVLRKRNAYGYRHFRNLMMIRGSSKYHRTAAITKDYYVRML